MAKDRTRRVTLSALLVAVMLILGYLESLIPLGVPGIKLGLSNSVLLLAMYWLGIPATFLLMITKVLLSGLLFSGVSAMMYALAGGLLSTVVMSILYLLTDLGPVVTGVAGAVTHNVGQVGLAMIILRTQNLVYYMGVLMLVGMVTGFVTGTVAKLLMQRLPSSLQPEQKPGKFRKKCSTQGDSSVNIPLSEGTDQEKVGDITGSQTSEPGRKEEDVPAISDSEQTKDSVSE